MTAEPGPNLSEAFQQLLADRKQERYHLRLYVAGMTVRSTNAVAALKSLCEQVLPDRYELEVVNLLEHPELAVANQILAVPTLVKVLPLPVRRLVGDLTKQDQLILMLQ